MLVFKTNISIQLRCRITITTQSVLYSSYLFLFRNVKMPYKTNQLSFLFFFFKFTLSLLFDSHTSYQHSHSLASFLMYKEGLQRKVLPHHSVSKEEKVAVSLKWPIRRTDHKWEGVREGLLVICSSWAITALFLHLKQVLVWLERVASLGCPFPQLCSCQCNTLTW